MTEVCVITFSSVAHAFRAEKILQGKGFDVKLIPVPRRLTDSCDGLAAVVNESDIDTIVELLVQSGVGMLRKGVRVRVD